MPKYENTRFDDEAVSAVFALPFGTRLFNDYTFDRQDGCGLIFSNRLRVVRAMLRAMLDTEEEIVREELERLKRTQA